MRAPEVPPVSVVHRHSDSVGTLRARVSARVARRGIALKVNPRKDRDRLWKVIAGTSLHLTVQPVANWLEWFDAAGWSVFEGDDAREEYMLVPTAHR